MGRVVRMRLGTWMYSHNSFLIRTSALLMHNDPYNALNGIQGCIHSAKHQLPKMTRSPPRCDPWRPRGKSGGKSLPD